MIHDSVPWKSELGRDAALIERWAAKPSVSDRRSFLIERKVFLAAYTLRKLDDAAKVSTAIMSQHVGVTRFAPVKEGYSELNSHRFDDYFDVEKPTRQTLPLRRLLDVLIHSLVFVEVLREDDTVAAFMVTSDRETGRGLYQIDLPPLVECLRAVAGDFPPEIIRMFDPVKNKWLTWVGEGGPPPHTLKEFEAVEAEQVRLAKVVPPTG